MDNADVTPEIIDAGTAAYNATVAELAEIARTEDTTSDVAVRVDRRKAQMLTRGDAYRSAAAIASRSAEMPSHERRRQAAADRMNVFGSALGEVDLHPSLREPSAADKYDDSRVSERNEMERLGYAADIASRQVERETERLFQSYGVGRRPGQTPYVGRTPAPKGTIPAIRAQKEAAKGSYKPTYCPMYEDHLAKRRSSGSAT